MGLTLSAPRAVAVRDLIGVERDAAVAALQAAAAVVLKELKLPHTPAGLTLGAQTLLESAENAGEIGRQQPAGAVVVLKELNRPHTPAGLTLGAQTLLESAENVGQIVRQQPSARARAALFSTVDVSVATLPRSVVPN